MYVQLYVCMRICDERDWRYSDEEYVISALVKIRLVNVLDFQTVVLRFVLGFSCLVCRDL